MIPRGFPGHYEAAQLRAAAEWLAYLTDEQLAEHQGVFYMLEGKEWCDLPTASYFRTEQGFWERSEVK